jgi:hypothetical protein
MVTSLENETVIDDLNVFPGWDQFLSLRPGGRVFVDPKSERELTVLHANMNPIEITNGVDLVYFVHDYRSFIVIQYKRVIGHGKHRYVRVNYALDRQRDRMRSLESTTEMNPPTGSLLGYRLSDSMCYFKLCETDQPADVSDLSRGRYVNLATWGIMESEGLLEGLGCACRFWAVSHPYSSFARVGARRMML